MTARTTLSQRALSRVLKYIDSRISEDIAVTALAREAGLSVAHFQRVFRYTTGVPPHTFVMLKRMERALESIERTSLPIAHVAIECGWSDQSHLNRWFLRLLGTTPGRWRRWRRGLQTLPAPPHHRCNLMTKVAPPPGWERASIDPP